MSARHFVSKRKSNFKYIEKNKWRADKAPKFKWASEQAKKHKLKQKILWALETFIACSNLKDVSLAAKETILKKYNEKHPEDTITWSTLFRYMKILERAKLIKNFGQSLFNGASKIKVLITKSVNFSVSFLNTNFFIENKKKERSDYGATPLPLIEEKPPSAEEAAEARAKLRAFLKK